MHKIDGKFRSNVPLFGQGYESERVIALYVGMLARRKEISDLSVHYITKMLHRIFLKEGSQPLMYKVCPPCFEFCFTKTLQIAVVPDSLQRRHENNKNSTCI